MPCAMVTKDRKQVGARSPRRPAADRARALLQVYANAATIVGHALPAQCLPSMRLLFGEQRAPVLSCRPHREARG